MSDDRKTVREKLSADPANQFGLGQVSAEFEADKYPGSPLLDTRVTLSVSEFSITWEDRVKLLRDIQSIVDKYLI